MLYALDSVKNVKFQVIPSVEMSKDDFILYGSYFSQLSRIFWSQWYY